eukprot:12892858-Prorocentrum_lima.AAC.1
MNGLAHWLADIVTRLELGIRRALEPRTILTTVNEAMQRVVNSDHILKMLWVQMILEPPLRSPSEMEGIAEYFRTVLGE